MAAGRVNPGLSLAEYKGPGYRKINAALLDYVDVKEIKDEETKRHILNIDSMMTEGKEEILLYRGVSFMDNFFDTNDVLVHKNFCSASKDWFVARTFTGDKCCMMSFILPPSIRRYDYGDKQEKEILIQRNIQFTFRNGYRVIRGMRVYEAIISEYSPPVIPQEIQKKSAYELDLKVLENEWREELLESLQGGKITKQAVKMLIESKKPLHFEQSVYDALELALIPKISADELDLKQLEQEWAKELSEGKVTKQSVKMLIESKQYLNYDQRVYDILEKELMKQVPKQVPKPKPVPPKPKEVQVQVPKQVPSWPFYKK